MGRLLLAVLLALLALPTRSAAPIEEGIGKDVGPLTVELSRLLNAHVRPRVMETTWVR